MAGPHRRIVWQDAAIIGGATLRLAVGPHGAALSLDAATKGKTMFELKSYWTFDAPFWMESQNAYVTKFETGIIFDTRADAVDWRDKCWLTGPALRQGHHRTIELKELSK